MSAAKKSLAAPDAGPAAIATAVVFYCFCSGGMLLVNKLAVYHVPSPAIVTLCQFASASVFVYSCKLLGVLDMDGFEWSKAKYFVVYVISFSIGTWANMKVLSMANVETVIVFRSCTPLAVAFFEYCFFDRALPTLRSWLSLALITTGAFCYILTDREFQVKGVSAYYWAMIWWAVLVFQLTYGKFLVTGIDLRSLWTPVLYTNTFSIIPALLVGLIAGEFNSHRMQKIHDDMTPIGFFWLIVSCVVGVCISWAGFWCQTLITATAYTVVGVMNKMLTVTVNVLIWDKHASSVGIGSLILCLVGGSLYQQAPPRNASVAHEPLPLLEVEADASNSADEESGRLVRAPRRMGS
uniref:Sugar phosphate transporter domain-containing protein n=1 Tax=Chrysotila carterae TaxID=13221 RepID=A0A7S4BTG6_CHRCT